MAHTNDGGFVEPGFKAASAILPYVAVKLDTVANQVLPCATTTDRPLGMTIASSAQGGVLAVMGPGNIVKGIAVASIGFGAEVGIASSNGALGAISGASGFARWAVGTTRTSAGAGERLSIFVNPRQLSGLI